MTSSDTHPPVEPAAAQWSLLQELIERELADKATPVDSFTEGIVVGLRGALAYMKGIERSLARRPGDLVQAVEK